MYRDVEQGSGVLESLRHITFEGFRLPWMVTLERMGYLSGASAVPLLLLTSAIVVAIWTVRTEKTAYAILSPAGLRAAAKSRAI